MKGHNGISINQLGKESNSLEIGSQARRVNTHHTMDKKKHSKIPKGELKMIKIYYPSSFNPFIKFMSTPKVEFSSMGFI